MPQFYFHLHQDGQCLVDPEGVELESTALRDYAVAIARDLAAADVETGFVRLDSALDIVDETGAQVLWLTFADVVAFLPPGAI